MPKDSTAPRRLASLAEAGEYASVHPRTIRREIARGTLTGYRFGQSKALRVDLNEVDALLRPIPTAGPRAS